MMTDAQKEYAAALAAYNAAMERLREAKKHIPQSPQDRAREKDRERRRLKREKWMQQHLAAQKANQS